MESGTVWSEMTGTVWSEMGGTVWSVIANLNRDNRKWLKSRSIRYSGKPLGRPPKIEKTAYQKRKEKKEQASRNHIEGKFGQAKNGYNLNKIRARLKETSESWICGIFFIMNLTRLVKVHTSQL